MATNALDAMLKEYEAIRAEIRLHKESLRRNYFLLFAGLTFLAGVAEARVAGDFAWVVAPMLILGFVLLSVNDNFQILVMAKHLERLEGRINKLAGHENAVSWELVTAALLWRFQKKNPLGPRWPVNFFAYVVAYPVLAILLVALIFVGAKSLLPWGLGVAVAYAVLLYGSAVAIVVKAWSSLQFIREGGVLDQELARVFPPSTATPQAPASPPGQEPGA